MLTPHAWVWWAIHTSWYTWSRDLPIRIKCSQPIAPFPTDLSAETLSPVPLHEPRRPVVEPLDVHAALVHLPVMKAAQSPTRKLIAIKDK